MGIEVSAQVAQLCFSALLGAAFCFVYDTLRLIRGRIKLKIVTGILDFLFWILVAVGAVWFFMTALGGELRLFAVFGIICGGVLWYLSLSKLYLKIGFTIIDAVVWVFLQILRPFMFVFRKIKKFFRFIKRKSKNYFKLHKKHSMIKRRSIGSTHKRFLKERRRSYREVKKVRTNIQNSDDLHSRIHGD